jgi:hypothetical protein
MLYILYFAMRIKGVENYSSVFSLGKWSALNLGPLSRLPWASCVIVQTRRCWISYSINKNKKQNQKSRNKRKNKNRKVKYAFHRSYLESCFVKSSWFKDGLSKSTKCIICFRHFIAWECNAIRGRTKCSPSSIWEYNNFLPIQCNAYMAITYDHIHGRTVL